LKKTGTSFVEGIDDKLEFLHEPDDRYVKKAILFRMQMM
jgi:hypothetical protein